jgi:carboxyl-terminal processing protease
LKLTTAGYQRPSGKNIHRFPGAEPQEEWGVKPNDGYEVKLSQDEAMKLIEHERRVLIVKPKADGNGAETDVPEADFADPQLAKGLSYLEATIAASPPQEPEKKEEAAAPKSEQAEKPAPAAVKRQAAA